MKKTFLYTLLILLVANSSFAATYYMRSDGTAANKEAATSCSAANTSMDETEHNSESFSSSDIIELCDDGGSYTTALVISTASNGVTYQVASGDVVLITATSGYSIDIAADNVTLQIGSGTSWTIANSGGTDNMVRLHDASGSSSNGVIDGLWFGPDATEGCLKVDNADNWTIKNNRFWNCGNNAGSEDENIAVFGTADTIYFEYNDFKGDVSVGDAFLISGNAHDIHIRYNNFHDWTFDDCGGECSEQFIDVKDEVYNIYIYGNLFDTTVNYQAILFHNANSAGSLDDPTIRDIYVYGNMFKNNTQGGINVWARNNRDIEGIYIFSNIFFESSPSYAVQMTGGGSGEPSNFHIFNNTILDTSGTSNYPIVLSDGGIEAGANSIKNNIVENNTQASNVRLLWSNGVATATTTYGRWYDLDGTAKCYDNDGTERDCDDAANFGANNEISQTTFTTRAAGADLSTASNITPAEDIGALCTLCDLGIKEGYDFSSVGIGGSGAVELVSRDNYNSGAWGKGAVVYGSFGGPPPDLSESGTITFNESCSNCGIFTYDQSGSGRVTR
jgi:hypothetical protein